MHGFTGTEPPTLSDLSSIAAEGNPNNTAFADPERRLTWREFDRESAKAANALRDYVSQGDRVAFLCESSVDHAVALNGVLKAGAIPSNFHVRAAPATHAYCIETIRPRVLVVDEAHASYFEDRVRENVSGKVPTILTLERDPDGDVQSLPDRLADRSETDPDVHVQPGDIAAIYWTSGTTGRPKGWSHTHEGILYKGLRRTTPTDRSSRRLVVLSPGFGAWWNDFVCTLLSTGTTVFRTEWEPEDIVELVEEERLTRLVLVTTMWREILRLDALEEYDLTSVEEIFSTGEMMDRTTLDALQDQICETVKNGYASTEVLGTTISSAEMDGERIKSVGKPMIGQRVRVVEEGGSPDDVLEPGEVGEIIVKGPDAPVWVWGDSERTDDYFVDGWWYSGDLGYRDEDGFFYLEGRADFMITSKGMKVFPTPVEERLNAHPGVEEAAVVGVEDEEYGERVTALVTRSDPSVTETDLDEWCLESDSLARFERPRSYRFVDSAIPRTATGKLDRKTAKDRFIE